MIMQTQRLPLLFILLGLFYSAHAQVAITADKLDLKFVTIPAGRFIMGTTDLSEAIADLPDPEAEKIDDESPAHTVIFERSFQISQTLVTQKLWLDTMGTKPGPKLHWAYKNWQQRPVVDVTWYDANRFIDQLNKTSDNKRYRLPTEAEWEYAARAGSTGLRPFSRLAMDEHAWFIHNSNDEVQAVAQLEPNAWGLYDMYGNVWEWVSDWYSPTTYTSATRINPQGPTKGTKKVRRGGSFHCPPHLIRSAYRATNTPDKSYSVLGFRLVTEKKQPPVKP
jgi:sulfatase modifying factor 1